MHARQYVVLLCSRRRNCGSSPGLQSGDPLRAPIVTPQEVEAVITEAQRFMLASHLM